MGKDVGKVVGGGLCVEEPQSTALDEDSSGFNL